MISIESQPKKVVAVVVVVVVVVVFVAVVFVFVMIIDYINLTLKLDCVNNE